MEISVNGKILINGNENGNKKIMKNGNETEKEKFEMETDKFGYVHFRFRCISVSCHHTGFMQRNTVALAVTVKQKFAMQNKTTCIPNIRPSITQTVDLREKWVHRYSMHVIV